MSRWAVIGKVGDEFAEKACSMLKKWGPYRTQRKDGNIRFAISYSKRGRDPLLQNSGWMTEKEINEFKLGKYKASPAVKEIDKLAIDPNSFSSLEATLNERSGIKQLDLYDRIIFNASIEQ